MNAVLRRQFAQCGKAFGQARFVGVVARYQQFSATQPGAHRQDRFEIGHTGCRLKTQDLQVEHLDARVAQARLGLPTQFGIGNQREMPLLFGGWHQP
ncbi:hypothetical protein D3C77_701500 [compost metagenome]